MNKDNPSYEFLKTIVLQERSDSYSAGEETIYTQNLKAAKKFFLEKLAVFNLSELEVLYTKVTQHLMFNVYSISREIEVFVAFETMNNRGKPLSHLELLKNRLIFLSTKFEVDKEEKARLRRTVNDSWKTIYHNLGRNKDQPLDDDLFLVMHYWLRFPPDEESNDPLRRRYWSPSNDHQKNELLDSIFTVKNLPQNKPEKERLKLTVQRIYDYAHDIKDAVKLFYEIYNPSDGPFSDEEKIWLEKLGRIADSDEMMFVMAFYQTPTETETRVNMLRTLESVLFIKLLSPYVSGVEPFAFATHASNLAAKKQTATQVLNDLSKHDKTLRNAIGLPMILKEWGKRFGYRWKGIRYFLFEYEQDLRSRSKTTREKLSWREFVSENYQEDYLTVEHIYPQKATHDDWKLPFQHFTIKQRNILRNSIGNLVPLAKPKNSSLGNKPFHEKKGSEGSTVGYIYGCYSENEVARSEHWCADEIVDRTLKMLSFIERRWRFNFEDHDKLLEALGLDFVLAKQQQVFKALEIP